MTMSDRVEDANRQIYNSRIIDSYLKLIKNRYSYVNISALLEYAGMKPYEVADQAHWFTQEQIDLFYEQLVQLTGNENIAREAGRYAASPDASGVMRLYFLGLVGPANAFKLIGKASTNFTRSARFEPREIGLNKVDIVVTPNDGVNEKPFQCQNRIGFFEAILMLFDYEMPRIEHEECIFKGGKVCRYTITWETKLSSYLKRFMYLFMLSVTCVVAYMMYIKPHFTFYTLLPYSLIIVLLLIIITKKREKEELRQGIDRLRGSTDQLLEQINANYNNALLANEIGQAISRQTDLSSILAGVIQSLESRLDYDRGLILLADKDKTKLSYCAGFGYPDEQLVFLRKAEFHLNRPESKGVFIISFREQQPFLINDVNEIESSLSLRSMTFARKIGAKSFICCPIICDGESIGILAVDNVKSKRPLVQSDMSLLMGIAPVIGVSIHKAMLIEAKMQQFSSILQVMAASIDARDPLTAGHSEKVTEYAVGICEEMGLAREFTEMIRVAALLHDYGKIGVPDAILKKNGRLTDLEYEVVKTHSYKTRDILEQISFEGIYCQVPEIAGSHHEKIDGSGYPRGLRGKDIPFGAKIIAVADFFEAVTTKRHYREPMPIDEAFRLLREGCGSHFEKKIVESFVRYYFKSRAAREADELPGHA